MSPNTEWDDVWLAIKMIPGIIFRGTARNNTQKYAEKLEDEFKKYLGTNFAYSFNSGRSSLMAILYALGIKEGDSSFAKASGDKEILIQAFTCNAVPNPILWLGAKPIYVDIDDSLNIDPEDLEKKICSRSRAIIVQYTFGFPVKMDRILEIAKRHNLYVVEDCAHSLGARYDEKLVGTIGDIAFFSFGRDKVISSVWGGMVATNNPDFAGKIEEFQQNLFYPSKFWIFQQLLHPILFNLFILPFYNFFSFGKLLLVLFQKFNLLSKAVTKKEKAGLRPPYFPKKMPEALAMLALNQFRKLERFNEHRRKIADLYKKNLIRKFEKDSLFVDEIPGGIYWRYPIFAENPEEIAKKAKKSGILFDDGWWGSSIMPKGTELAKMGYKIGDCPKAEKIAKHILSLPTHVNISEKDAQKIVNFLADYGNQKNRQ